MALGSNREGTVGMACHLAKQIWPRLQLKMCQKWKLLPPVTVVKT
jgi:hypothetical protein